MRLERFKRLLKEVELYKSTVIHIDDYGTGSAMIVVKVKTNEVRYDRTIRRN